MSPIERRRFLSAASALAVAPLVARARQAATLPRIGVLEPGTRADGTRAYETFRKGLIEIGHTEGGTVEIVRRWADRKNERLTALAVELVHDAKVDLIFTYGCDKRIIEAIRGASRTVPLVIGFCGDIPGFQGEVATFAKPGGHTTGLTFFAPELSAKRLALVKELVPRLSTALVLWNPDAGGLGGWEPYWRELHRASASLDMELKSLEVRNASELESGFSSIKPDLSIALITLWDPIVLFNRKRIIKIALQRRLVACYDHVTFADEGGLLAYATNYVDMLRRASVLVDKILKGANPGSIPIERPTEFQLVINLKTARAIGVEIPELLLLRADRIIE
jgi:putative ABC transport system substrate-binding protein